VLLGCFQDQVNIYKEHLLIVLSSSIKTFSTSGSSVLMMPLTATEGQGELGVHPTCSCGCDSSEIYRNDTMDELI